MPEPKRPRIPRGPGSIKVAEDSSGKPCFICGGDSDVRFILVKGPEGEFYLRACAGCCDVIAVEHLTLPRGS